MIKVLIVDDHQVVRLGLRAIVDAQSDLEACGEAADGESALPLVRDAQPDVVIMDLSMPGMGGVEATRAILAERPSTRVLVLSWHADGDHVRAAMSAGAAGYLLKGDESQRLVDAVRAVHRGEDRMSEGLAQHIVS
jgi:DNA-binding NarL/FixJ family response regulator